MDKGRDGDKGIRGNFLEWWYCLYLVIDGIKGILLGIFC